MTKGLRSSYLFIGSTPDTAVLYGADSAPSLAVAEQLCLQQKYAVIVCAADIGNASEVYNFLKKSHIQSQNTQYILAIRGLSADILRTILAAVPVYRLVEDFNEPHFNEILTKAQEHYAQIEQRHQLFHLLKEQNENLLRLSKELEDRVAKRQQNILKAREKLVTANQQTEGLQRALIALNRAKTIPEIESLIRDALSEAFAIEWLKIDLFSNPFNTQVLQQHTKDSIFSCPLYQGSRPMGSVIFGRQGSKLFSPSQENFLSELAESISLAVFRLNNQRHFELLKGQWESTFDAITRPLSLVDSNYTIVRCNKSYAQKSEASTATIIGKKCYEVLFRRTQPCLNCQLGQKFRLPKQAHGLNAPVVYEVTSQLLNSPSDKPLYINIYHDITESLKLETQILESSREAEIGLVGSSIAHELNNPLAGILSFIQVIKMDLKPDDFYAHEILEMEKAALRCKDIISNLLGFSRLTPLTNSEFVDLNEVLIQSKEIFQLKAKSNGIEITIKSSDKKIQIEGQFNLLVQAMGHLINMALSALSEQRQIDKSLSPHLFIELYATSEFYFINFSTSEPLDREKESQPLTNTFGLKESISLDLQVTSQIIKDHLGQLSIISLGKVFKARVKFPRPETQPKSQEVDMEI